MVKVFRLELLLSFFGNLLLQLFILAEVVWEHSLSHVQMLLSGALVWIDNILDLLDDGLDDVTLDLVVHYVLVKVLQVMKLWYVWNCFLIAIHLILIQLLDILNERPMEIDGSILALSWRLLLIWSLNIEHHVPYQRQLLLLLLASCLLVHLHRNLLLLGELILLILLHICLIRLICPYLMVDLIRILEFFHFSNCLIVG